MNRPKSGSVGNNVIEVSQSDRRWAYSGRWFTISVGRQRSPISRSLNTETALRTYAPDNPRTNAMAFWIPTNNCTTNEQTEQESPVTLLDHPLMP